MSNVLLHLYCASLFHLFVLNDYQRHLQCETRLSIATFTCSTSQKVYSKTGKINEISWVNLLFFFPSAENSTILTKL